jgi:hypothetical protein
VTSASSPVPEPGSKRHLLADPLQLSAVEMRMLLDDLDRRLCVRGTKASLYVVGGAALALAGGREQLTPDIDAITTVTAVWEEAAIMAREYGLPVSWINGNAAPYIPPRPPAALVPPTRVGLTVHLAPQEHLLAMKVIAMRIKDRPDIERLLVDLGLLDAEPGFFVELLYRVYRGEGCLENALNVPGADPDRTREEVRYLSEAVVRIAESLR